MDKYTVIQFKKKRSILLLGEIFFVCIYQIVQSLLEDVLLSITSSLLSYWNEWLKDFFF